MHGPLKKPNPKFLMIDPKQIKRFGKSYRGYNGKERIVPFRKSFSVSHQTDIYFNPEKGAKYHVGDYFELLAQCMYGGVNQKTLEVRTLNPAPSSIINLSPDTLSINEGWVREIKGISLGNGLRLSDDKMLGYTLLQLSNNLFKKPPQIFFEIFRYGIYGRGKHEDVEKRFGPMSLDEKLNFLSNNLRYQLSIPFSLMFQMYLSPMWLITSSKKSPVYRCDNNTNHEQSYPETKIKAKTLIRLLLEPKKMIEEFGIDPNNFKISYAKSPIIKVNRHKIRDFPVLIIRDKIPTSSPKSSFVEYLRTITNDSSEIFTNLYEELHEIYPAARTSDDLPFPFMPRRKTIKIGSGGYPEDWDNIKSNVEVKD